MTTDPVDAALDVWFEDPSWRDYQPDMWRQWRARMRRVLDAHDAVRSHVATDVMLEGARAAWNTGENVDRWLSLSDLKIIVDGAMAAGGEAAKAAKEGK